jgi:hypothetical protein
MWLISVPPKKKIRIESLSKENSTVLVKFPTLFISYKSNIHPRRSSSEPWISIDSVAMKSSNRIKPEFDRSIFRKRNTE